MAFSLSLLCTILLAIYVAAQIQAPTSTDYLYYDEEPLSELTQIELSIPDSAVRGDFPCPEPVGDFEDSIQCDKYWRCNNNVAYALLCDDGLVFDFTKAGRDDPCDSPYVVDCKTKTKLQEPTFPSRNCPRRHGLFADVDPQVCDVFYTCIEGQSTKTTCATTLFFNEKTGICTWPHDSGRTQCGSPKRETVDGFTCPVGDVVNSLGLKTPHPTYAHEDDCQKFFVCLNGILPQAAACELGMVFNNKTGNCAQPGPEIPECLNWYANDPRFEYLYVDYMYDTSDTKGTSGDTGAQSV